MTDHYAAVAPCYAAYRPRYPAALVELLAAETTPGVAWDVGCGSGQLAVALAAHFARVIATDPSPAQLAAATRHPRVAYEQAAAEASGLPDAVADLVVAAQAAHWFDWPRFVAEAGRVARPGGLVALVSYGRVELAGPAGREIAHYYDEVVPTWWPPGREHVDNGYRDLVMPWPAVEAPLVEMTARWTREQLVGYVSSWSATARLVAHAGPAAFDALCERLAATWPDAEPRTVRWPLAVRLARR